MEKRRLGRTGFEVSALGFGGGPVGFLGTDQDRVTSIVNYLLDNGVNFIDTAAGYPGSEEALGNAVNHRRDEYVLVSKCGQAFDDLEGEAWSAQVIEQTVDRALRRLKTDHLDVMLLHGCDQEILERGEAVEALVKARDAGKIRYAGYSGDNEAGLYAAGLDAIDVIETSVNICDQANIDSLLPEARGRDIGVIVKRPVAAYQLREFESAIWRLLAFDWVWPTEIVEAGDFIQIHADANCIPNGFIDACCCHRICIYI